MKDNYIDNRLQNAFIYQAKNEILPDKLGLLYVAELLFYERKQDEIKKTEEEKKRAGVKGNSLPFGTYSSQWGFIKAFSKLLDGGLFPIEGYTQRILFCGSPGKEKMEPIVSKQTVKNILKVLGIDLDIEKLALRWLCHADKDSVGTKGNQTNINSLSGKNPIRPINNLKSQDDWYLIIEEAHKIYTNSSNEMHTKTMFFHWIGENNEFCQRKKITVEKDRKGKLLSLNVCWETGPMDYPRFSKKYDNCFKKVKNGK